MTHANALNSTTASPGDTSALRTLLYLRAEQSSTARSSHSLYTDPKGPLAPNAPALQSGSPTTSASPHDQPLSSLDARQRRVVAAVGGLPAGGLRKRELQGREGRKGPEIRRRREPQGEENGHEA